MGQITEKTIDIDGILKNKMGNKAKWLPRPLVAWLKRIAHQDQVNAFLWESRDKVGTPWLEACVDYLQMTLEIEGKENLPDPADGRLYTFVSNHPLGGEDGVALGALIGFPAMVEAGFQSDNHMLMFPAGLCSRRHNGVIRDIAWKKTFIAKSVEYQRDVVPIHFGGQNSSFFYRLANFSDRFLPFNLAMLFLVDEMYKNVGKTFRVAIGKPIPWQTFDKSKSPMEWAKYVQDIVYNL